MRLNKYMASSGVCSRREADRLIESGVVTVDGHTARVGETVDETSDVRVNGCRIEPDNEIHVIAYYKPVGVTCSEKDDHADKLITDMIDYPVRLTYAGRLDRDSEGLMILTNDGDLIEYMMRGKYAHEKAYIVRVSGDLTDDKLKRMSDGMYLSALDRTTRPCMTRRISKDTFEIVLTEGLNRQIRRMCGTLSLNVQSLKRVRIMNIELGDLKPGQWRRLSEAETGALRGEGI